MKGPKCNHNFCVKILRNVLFCKGCFIQKDMQFQGWWRIIQPTHICLPKNLYGIRFWWFYFLQNLLSFYELSFCAFIWSFDLPEIVGSFRRATQRAVRRRKQPNLTVLHSSGRCALQALSRMSDAAQPKPHVWLFVYMHERIPSPRKVSDWLIPQLRRGFQYHAIFGE